MNPSTTLISKLLSETNQTLSSHDVASSKTSHQRTHNDAISLSKPSKKFIELIESDQLPSTPLSKTIKKVTKPHKRSKPKPKYKPLPPPSKYESPYPKTYLEPTTSKEIETNIKTRIEGLQEAKLELAKNYAENIKTTKEALESLNKNIEEIKSSSPTSKWIVGEKVLTRNEALAELEKQKQAIQTQARRNLLRFAKTFSAASFTEQSLSKNLKTIQKYEREGYHSKVVNGQLIFYKTKKDIEEERFKKIQQDYSRMPSWARPVRATTAAFLFGAFSPEFYSRLVTQGPESARRYIASEEYKIHHFKEYPAQILGIHFKIPTTTKAGKFAASFIGSSGFQNVIVPLSLGFGLGSAVGYAERVGTYLPTALKLGLAGAGIAATAKTALDIKSQLEKGNIKNALTTALHFGIQAAAMGAGFKAGRAYGFRKANFRWNIKHPSESTILITEKTYTPEGIKVKGKQFLSQQYKPTRAIRVTADFEATLNPETGQVTSISFTRGKVTTISTKTNKILSTKSLEAETLSKMNTLLNVSLSKTTGKIGKASFEAKSVSAFAEQPYTPSTKVVSISKVKPYNYVFSKGKIIDLTEFKPRYIESSSNIYITSFKPTPQGYLIEGYQTTTYPIGKGVYSEAFISFKGFKPLKGEFQLQHGTGITSIKTITGKTFSTRPIELTSETIPIKNIQFQFAKGKGFKIHLPRTISYPRYKVTLPASIEMGLEKPYFLQKGLYSSAKTSAKVGELTFASKSITSYNPTTKLTTTLGETLSVRGHLIKFYDVGKIHFMPESSYTPTSYKPTMYKPSSSSLSKLSLQELVSEIKAQTTAAITPPTTTPKIPSIPLTSITTPKIELVGFIAPITAPLTTPKSKETVLPTITLKSSLTPSFKPYKVITASRAIEALTNLISNITNLATKITPTQTTSTTTKLGTTTTTITTQATTTTQSVPQTTIQTYSPTIFTPTIVTPPTPSTFIVPLPLKQRKKKLKPKPKHAKKKKLYLKRYFILPTFLKEVRK